MAPLNELPDVGLGEPDTATETPMTDRPSVNPAPDRAAGNMEEVGDVVYV